MLKITANVAFDQEVSVRSQSLIFLFLSVAIAGTPIGPCASAATGSPYLTPPPLPAPTGKIVNVSSEADLQRAVSNLSDNTTIVLAPGQYHLTNTLVITRNHVTLRGATDRREDVVLIGKGMEESDFGNVPNGIWTNAVGLAVQNLTIRDVYHHPIVLNAGAESPHFYNVGLLDAGEQFIKANPSSAWGQGVDDGIVEYSVMEYTAGPPTTDHGGGTGYTNGVDVHGGQRWVIRNNLFNNFHTSDSANNLWNPAILMWRGSGGTVTEGNIFIDVDRAIAYGLDDDPQGAGHTGGNIQNNMIYYADGLYSAGRKAQSDGAIIVWDSPQTKVLHNTIVTNGNLNKSIEFRWHTLDATAKNNLVDAPISGRNAATFAAAGNSLSASSGLFVNPEDGDLHLRNVSAAPVPALAELPFDIDGQSRPFGTLVDVGADEYFDDTSSMHGDYNHDGLVNSADYSVWRSGFGDAVAPFTGGDGNGDGKVDASDYTIWRDNLGMAASVVAVRVPEPSSIALLGIVPWASTLIEQRKRQASVDSCRRQVLNLK